MSDFDITGIPDEHGDLAAVIFRSAKELRLAMVEWASDLPQSIPQDVLDLAREKGYQITCSVKNDRLWIYDPDETRLPNKAWRQT